MRRLIVGAAALLLTVAASPDPPAPVLNLNDSTVTATGSTASTSLADRFKQLSINARDYGADGNDTTDDTASLNAMFTAARNIISSTGSGKGVYINIPYGTYKTTAPLNATGLQAYPNSSPVTIDGHGATIDCQMTSGACLDMLGVTAVTLKNIRIFGNSAAGGNPQVGLQQGRLTTTSADRNHLSDVTIQGGFTLAAFYNLASEIWSCDHCRFYNSYADAGAYAAIFDGINHFGLTSTFQTESNTANSALPLDDAICYNCDIHNNAGGPTLWMANTQHFAMYGGYLLNQNAQPAVVLYTGGTNNRIIDPQIFAHIEQQTMPHAFLISGSLTPTIKGLQYEDQDSFVTTSVFALDTGTTSVTLQNPKIHIANFLQNSSALLFDTASNYTVTGAEIRLPSAANWATPSAFSGILCRGTSCQQAASTGSSSGGFRINNTTILSVPTSDTSNSIVGGGNNATLSTTASGITFFGQNAGAATTSGSFNVGFGQAALGSNTTASNNTAIGWHSCNAVTTGGNNVCIGEGTGATLTTGVSNILLGTGVDVPVAGKNNYLNIGNFIVGDTTKGILEINGPSVSLSGCGTSPSKATGSTDTHGTVTLGSGATGCTISWTNTHSNTPDCVVSSPTGSAVTSYTASSAGLVIVGGTDSSKFSWVCIDPGVAP